MPNPSDRTEVTAATRRDVGEGDGWAGSRCSQTNRSELPNSVFAACIMHLQVKLSFSGTGEAAFAGVALFAHPDVACRCEAGYFLDVGSAPVSMRMDLSQIVWKSAQATAATPTLSRKDVKALGSPWVHS